jgi:flavin reductase (DIM6/NTAB) family NADH-FMN oxidoreductase RutF
MTSRETERVVEDLMEVSPLEFRNALARWASGVTVVTARDDRGPIGMTASSFSSLSLDPPLVLVCVARSALSHEGLVAADGFAVHILEREQRDMSELFARAGAAKFDEYPDERGLFDAPLLPFGIARLECAHEAAHDGGDHTILVGRVLRIELAGADPLIYCNRGYHGLG